LLGVEKKVVGLFTIPDSLLGVGKKCISKWRKCYVC
jgi:hypothetical protein